MDASMLPLFIRHGLPTWKHPLSLRPWQLLSEKHRHLPPRPGHSRSRPLQKTSRKIPPHPNPNNQETKYGLFPHPRLLQIPIRQSRDQCHPILLMKSPLPLYRPVVVELRRRLLVIRRQPLLLLSKETTHRPQILAQPQTITHPPQRKTRDRMIMAGSKRHRIPTGNLVKRRSQSTRLRRRKRQSGRIRENEKSDEGNDENCASRELKTWPGCCWNPILIFPLIANIAGRLFWEVDQICKIRIACPPGSWKSWPFPTKSALFVNLAFPV
mmetsp:Transcript_116068/g.335205  ORF Transcript_116068/g.335205 Transcript_116068/m.335205 type:complete len:269 (-) Transcript_116068:323-1129(-)